MKKNKKQKGILTIDFVFSFTMIFGLFQMFYVLTYTLMVSQVTQYIAFASSRMYFAGHIDEQSQYNLAEQKYMNLFQNSAVASFFKSSFVLSNFEAREFSEIPTQTPWRQKYIGTRIGFESKVLDFNVPFLGSTSTELSGQGFKSEISSYLYREPTSSECFQFNEARAKAILDLNSKYGQAQSFGFDPNSIGVNADNGC